MTEKLSLWSMLLCSIILSVSTIIYSVIYRSAVDAGRGGALADTLVLFTFVVIKNYSQIAHDELAKRSIQTYRRILSRSLVAVDQEKIEKKEIDLKIRAINLKLLLDYKGQAMLNKFVAAAGAIGTLSWGFGDVLAQKAIDKLYTSQIHYDYTVRLF